MRRAGLTGKVWTGMKTRKILIFIITMLFLFETSCSHRPSKTNGSTIGVKDFNTTQVSWFTDQRPVVVADDGLYYILTSWLYYTDIESGKAYPLCYKIGCRHEDEDRVYLCDAYIGTNPNNPGEAMFLGSHQGKLYVRMENVELGRLQLIEMDMDGTNRRVVIEDTSSIDARSMLFHRGYLYFTSHEQKDNGDIVQQIRRVQIEKASGESEVLVEINRKEKSFYSNLPIFPLNDSLYYIEQVKEETDWVELYRYDLSTKKEELIADSQPFRIYGSDGDNLILLGAEKHLSYSPDTGIMTDAVWLNKLENQHPEWHCQSGCINEDFALGFVIEQATTNDPFFNPDLKVIDHNGNVLCEISGEAKPWTSPQVLTIKGEKYLVMYGPDYGENNSLDLYKVSELMQGIVEPKRIRRKQ